MVKIEVILHPTDFSPDANRALVHARVLASHFDAKLILLHCRTLHRDDPARVASELGNSHQTGNIIEAIRRDSPQLKVEAHVNQSVTAATGILEFVEAIRPDLVVLGTHGYSGLPRFFLGSVAERVLRHSAAPVLTVPRTAASLDLAGNGYKNILVGFDFSRSAAKAVRLAAALADHETGARIQVLYVLEEDLHPAFYDVWKDVLLKPPAYHALRKRIEAALPEIATEARQAVAAVLREEGLAEEALQVTVVEGVAHRELSRVCEKESADLVALGRHGLGGLDKFLLGSTTVKVLHRVDCPVLTLPEH